MNAIFGGLFLSEIVLLVLGILLFIVLLLGLAASMIRGKTNIKLLPFFFVTIVMIAYPTIQHLKISATELDIATYSTQLQQDPANQTVRNALSAAVSKIANRPFSDPVFLTKLAHAQLMLDDTQDAQTNLQKALRANPTLPEAVALRNRIQTEAQLPALTKQVTQHPEDTAAKTQLNQSVEDITKTQVANPATLTTIAKAQAALGNNDQAIVNANRALQINPQLTEAAELKTQIQARSQQ
jgi:tetratricopeptide (TPR) repeat protein